MSDEFSIDDIDRAIVEQLRLNGRATNQQIANVLGLTAATVSARIRRMDARHRKWLPNSPNFRKFSRPI